jgi:hypothetical protein
MKHLENYYRNLCEQLQQQIAILEAKMKDKNKDKKEIKKADKKADKDYDGDGKIESAKEEYFGSKDKAIKKKMAEKKKMIKEGREVQGGIMNYGGFPRVSTINEAVTTDMQDSTSDNKPNVATLSNNQEVDLNVKGGMGLKYPSEEYAKLGHQAYDLETQMHGAMKAGNRDLRNKIALQRHQILKQMETHPHHTAFLNAAEKLEKSVRGGNYGE